jgi:hypothetical protein
MLNWSGLYAAESQKVRIRIDSSHLDDPESLVATYAHELAHAHLLGQGRILPDEPDCEPLTDLATVFFGLGIFGANVAFRQESYFLGNHHATSQSRQGYLTVEQWAYALALFACLRGEQRPAWVRYLRHNVRGPCRAGLACLKAGDGILAAMTSGNVVRASTVSAATTSPAPESDDAAADVSASESDQQEADMAEGDPFTSGMM